MLASTRPEHIVALLLWRGPGALCDVYKSETLCTVEGMMVGQTWRNWDPAEIMKWNDTGISRWGWAERTQGIIDSCYKNHFLYSHCLRSPPPFLCSVVVLSRNASLRRAFDLTAVLTFQNWRRGGLSMHVLPITSVRRQGYSLLHSETGEWV